MSSCRKVPYRSRAEAEAAARAITGARLDFGKIRTYRCSTCRFPDRQRSWHWAHARPGTRLRRR